MARTRKKTRRDEVSRKLPRDFYDRDFLPQQRLRDFYLDHGIQHGSVEENYPENRSPLLSSLRTPPQTLRPQDPLASLAYDAPVQYVRDVQDKTICERRSERAEVLHALRKTGKRGQKKARRTLDSYNVRCK